MDKKIQTALISVYHKEGLLPVLEVLRQNDVTIYSTGGTQQFLEQQGFACIAVETITGYPSILGGRVKTLHPSVFGGILGKRNDETHREEMRLHNIPVIDLVIVDLYPFEETVRQTNEENLIIEKIDIGGPSMLRAAAKNFRDVFVVASGKDYEGVTRMLSEQHCITSEEQRRLYASKAFDVCSYYDNAISNYFSSRDFETIYNRPARPLRYGENPHQRAAYFGEMEKYLEQLHGKEISYNNLVDIDAGLQLMSEFRNESRAVFAIIKHTNVCGISIRDTVEGSWRNALAGDPESAFGGVLVCNKKIDIATAVLINELFFEVLIALDFDKEALELLKGKKNRILLIIRQYPEYITQQKSVIGGILMQEHDDSSVEKWQQVGGRNANEMEMTDLQFANVVCKHLKSNAISLVSGLKLLGKGCGQTSRIDALRQAIDKARQFHNDLNDSVLASDAFFPFDDCVKIAHQQGIAAFIQPGGSIRDQDSIDYCKDKGLAMIITGVRHFKH